MRSSALNGAGYALGLSTRETRCAAERAGPISRARAFASSFKPGPNRTGSTRGKRAFLLSCCRDGCDARAYAGGPAQ
jgi:hypothetical protein